MNWDDLKYFLAVSRTGSIRGAAKALDVNHATVSRRINTFEKNMGLRLFDRTVQGYERTKAADEIYAQAVHLEDTLFNVQRLVEGKNKALRGIIRITVADIVAEHLLMDDLADFSKLYPDIEIHVIDSVRSFNLANREADVALRVCNHPPEHLIARKLAAIHRSAYASAEAKHMVDKPEWLAQQNWIGWTDKMRKPVGKMARDYDKFSSRHAIVNTNLQRKACRLGMGIAILPCFIGDNDDSLVRIAPFTSEHKFDLWLLTHPDMRENTKVKAFNHFIKERIMQKQPLIEGERPKP